MNKNAAFMNKKNTKKNTARTLKKRRTALENARLRQAKNDFGDTFIMVEIAYKELLKAYNRDHNKSVPDYTLKLDMRQIPKVLKYHDIQISCEKYLEPLFSGDHNGKYARSGYHSAKMLRDGIFHNLNVEYMKEVLTRYDELMKLMNHFLDTVTDQSERSAHCNHSTGLKRANLIETPPVFFLNA